MKSIERDTLYTNVALTDDGDVWWEGKDGPPPAACHRLEGQRLDARLERESGASEQPFRRADDEQSGARSRSRKRRRRADQRDHFRRTPRDTMPLVFQAFDWIHGVYVGATMGFRNDRRRRRAESARCGAIRWRCCRSADTTWAIISGTGLRSDAHDKSAAHFSRELVPQRQRRKISLAGLRRKHARAQMDHRPLRRQRRRREKRPSGPFLGPKTSISLRSRHFERKQLSELLSVKTDEWKTELEGQRSSSTPSQPDMPEALLAQREQSVAAKFAGIEPGSKNLRTGSGAQPDSLRWVRKTAEKAA